MKDEAAEQTGTIGYFGQDTVRRDESQAQDAEMTTMQGLEHGVGARASVQPTRVATPVPRRASLEKWSQHPFLIFILYSLLPIEILPDESSKQLSSAKRTF